MAMLPGAAKFRKLLASGRMIVAPGVYDGITAKLTEQAGFEAAYMTGAGTSAAHGYPDFGLITMSEMVANARRICDAIALPLVSDIDTGYGNELNVFRTIQQFERAGVAAVHLEDQVFPKKCGHLENKEVIALDDYVAKIRAAADARASTDFTLIARTDARAVLGFEEAIRRANAAIEAGADMAFVEAPQTMAEVEAVPRQVKGPCLLNIVLGGKTPIVDMATAERLGYAISIVPGLLSRSVVETCDAALRTLKETGRPPDSTANRPVRQFFNRLGADEWDRRRTAYRSQTKQAAE